jgi:hypothetical protein
MTSTISRPATDGPRPIAVSPVGPSSRAANQSPIPQVDALREPNSHATIGAATPRGPASRGSNSRPADPWTMPIYPSPDGVHIAAHQATDALAGAAGGEQQGRDREAISHSGPISATLLDPALSLAADFLDDVERVKLANENRLRALTRVGADADGVDRYVGLAADHPVVAQLAKMVESISVVEHDAVLNLQRVVRKHPLGAWIKAQRGIGEKQGARLLASIGDPYWRSELVREDGSAIPEGPRTVSALWAYCGLHVLPAISHFADDNHDPTAGGGDTSPGGNSSHFRFDTQSPNAGVAARRRRGQQSNWSTKAKTRAYLIAESCLKQLVKPCHAADFEGRWLAVHYDECTCSPYRLEYDRRKAHTSTSRPEWTDGHRHADALRVASKAILRDLWRAGRDWHLAQRSSV